MNIDYINTGYSKVHKAHQIIPLIFKGKLLLGSVIISGICLLKRKKDFISDKYRYLVSCCLCAGGCGKRKQYRQCLSSLSSVAGVMPC